jgi:GNAT superfamily N-acetyltransferase
MKQLERTSRLSFRPVTPEDEGLIADFFDAMGGESRALFNRRDYNRNGVLKFCRRGDATRRYFIAELDGRMAGYVFFLSFDTSVPELGLALRDDLQGQHLGRELVAFAIDEARACGKGGLLLTTHVANLRGQALYEAMGFVCMGQCKNGTELFYLYRYRE